MTLFFHQLRCSIPCNSWDMYYINRWAPPNELSFNIIKIVEQSQFWPWIFDGSSKVTRACRWKSSSLGGLLRLFFRVMWQCDAGSHDSDGCAWLSWMGASRNWKMIGYWKDEGSKYLQDFGTERGVEVGVEVTSGLCLTLNSPFFLDMNSTGQSRRCC